jgi:NhaP-type Na+/H+ or K+/H+ antiporter
MNEHVIVTLAGVGLLAVICQWLAWWVKLPAILFLLVGGILIGPLAGWLDPDALFGELLMPFVSLSVAVILFEGSLSLRFREIRGLEQVVRNLVTVGLVVTWAVTSIATWLLVDFPWEVALLFGALTVVTGPTVIVPMLRTVRPNAAIANILRWEGIVIDPLGALLSVLVFEFILSGHGSAAIAHTLSTFGKTMLAGLVPGAVAGFALGLVLRHHWLPEYLHNITTLALVFAGFAAANVLQDEAGLLAVTVMGIWLANMKGVNLEEILNFKESLSLVLISGLFILLAARIEFTQLHHLGWGGIGVLVAMQFVARPLKVLVSTPRSSLTWQERALLGWIAPRGIVAAAMAAVFAIRLQRGGTEEAVLLVPLTFVVIIGTVVLQSATAGALARWLGVGEPEPKGYLVIGANPVARAIGTALNAAGFGTVLADSNWDNIRNARMEGLTTFYGNPVSGLADRSLDLIGIGGLLALSHHAERNALAAFRYRREFGANAIYTLLPAADESPLRQAVIGREWGHLLFGQDITYAKLASLLSKGAKIRSTTLTEDFDFDAYRAKHGKGAIPLFAVKPRGSLHIFTAGDETKPAKDWTIISLFQADGKK